MFRNFRFIIASVLLSSIAVGCGGSSKHHKDMAKAEKKATKTESSKTTEAAKTKTTPPAVRPTPAPRDPYSTVGREAELAGQKEITGDPPHNITLDEIREAVQKRSAVIVDARSPQSYAEGHVLGAINIPAGEIQSHLKLLKEVPRDKFMIIYCSSASCHASDMVYEYLLGEGFTNMRVYSPGWIVLASAKNLH